MNPLALPYILVQAREAYCRCGSSDKVIGLEPNLYTECVYCFNGNWPRRTVTWLAIYDRSENHIRAGSYCRGADHCSLPSIISLGIASERRWTACNDCLFNVSYGVYGRACSAKALRAYSWAVKGCSRIVVIWWKTRRSRGHDAPVPSRSRDIVDVVQGRETLSRRRERCC